MANTHWKNFERTVAKIVSGTRFWANSGQQWDVGPGPGTARCPFLVQCKIRKSFSLSELTDLAEIVSSGASTLPAVGMIAIKQKRGARKQSPILFVLPEDQWAKLCSLYGIPHNVSERIFS